MLKIPDFTIRIVQTDPQNPTPTDAVMGFFKRHLLDGKEVIFKGQVVRVEGNSVTIRPKGARLAATEKS